MATIRAAVLGIGMLAVAQPCVRGQCDSWLDLVPDDTFAGALVGASVAVDGGLAVVGAPGVDGAYVYDAVTGALLHRLEPPDGAGGDAFGSSVAITGDLVLVAAPGDDDRGDGAGAVCLFDASDGGFLGKLFALDTEARDAFGAAVAVEGGRAVVTASGAGLAYLFDIADPVAPVELSRFRPAFYRSVFGVSVAMSGARVIVASGEWFSVDPTASLFDISDPGSPEELAELELENDTYFQFWSRLGVRVAISGDTAAVGTYAYDYGDGRGSTVSLFDSTTGERVGTIRPPDDAENDIFGVGVAMHGERLAVTSICGPPPKMLYLYDVSNPAEPQTLGWFQREHCAGYLLPVAMSASTIVAGGPWDTGNDLESGAAYSFDPRSCGMCPADWNDDGEVDSRDVVAFLNDWVVGEADFNRDGVVDTRDVVAFLGAWAGGC